jgi:hypothetical protein
MESGPECPNFIGDFSLVGDFSAELGLISLESLRSTKKLRQESVIWARAA